MPSSSRPLAVVTGASSGIGRQFAYRHAREGFDVVLVGRSKDALRTLATDLTKKHGIKAEVHAADLSKPADIDALIASIEQLPRLDHLINCAGTNPEGDFARADVDELRQMIDINVTALTLLTRAAVIRMRAAGNGAIINIASGASYQPTPYLAAYGASKSYVRMFTEALYEENRRYGVRIFAVSPGNTDTPMNPGKTKNWRQPDQVVDTAWRALTKTTPSVVDGSTNSAVATLASRFLPRRTGLRIAERMFRDKA